MTWAALFLIIFAGLFSSVGIVSAQTEREGIVGAREAHREAERQVREMDRDFEPKPKEPPVDKPLFERNREALERAQREGKVGN